MAFTYDGQLAVSSADGFIRFFDMEGRVSRQLRCGGSIPLHRFVTVLQATSGGLMSVANWSGTTSLRRVSDGSTVCVLKGAKRTVADDEWAVDCSLNKRGFDSTLRVWRIRDLVSGYSEPSTKRIPGALRSMAVRQGHLAAFEGMDNAMWFIDLATMHSTRAEIRAIVDDHASPNAVTLTPDGNSVVVGCHHSVQLVDFESRKQVQEIVKLGGGDALFQRLAFNNSGSLLAAHDIGYSQAKFRCWRVKDGSEVYSFDVFEDPNLNFSFCWSPTENVIAFLHSTGSIGVLRLPE